jgi:hypothetical protein
MSERVKIGEKKIIEKVKSKSKTPEKEPFKIENALSQF